MTVLGLKTLAPRQCGFRLARRSFARDVDGAFPGKSEEAVPIGHITNGVHVPSWLAPQMFRLYDRHLGTGWHERSGEAQDLGRNRERGRRRTLGDAPQPEIAPAGICAPPRG